TGATLAFAVVMVSGRWVPGWQASAAAFVCIAAGVPLLRWLAGRFPRARVFDAGASFWLLIAAPLAHRSYGPVVDTVSVGLRDGDLAVMDLRLFHLHPSLAAGQVVPGWALDVLLACYYTYFLWPALLAAVLYFRRDRASFDRYSLALALT